MFCKKNMVFIITCISMLQTIFPLDDLVNHPALQKLQEFTDLKHTCGYVTMLNSGAPLPSSTSVNKGINHEHCISTVLAALCFKV